MRHTHATSDLLFKAALIADSYSLGLHWIYDTDLLDREPQEPDRLHPPLSHWHGTKQAGELTHYGDQLVHLQDYCRNHQRIQQSHYQHDWARWMSHYQGYIDKATASTLKRLEQGLAPAGSCSTELAVVSRIIGPLPLSNSRDEYLTQIDALVAATHNAEPTLMTARFFATVLLELLEGRPLLSTLEQNLSLLQPADAERAQQGLASATEETPLALRHFGIACEIHHALPGVLHLLTKYDQLVPLLQQNARAGGDSSARGMIAAILLTASKPDKLKQVPHTLYPAVLR